MRVTNIHHAINLNNGFGLLQMTNCARHLKEKIVEHVNHLIEQEIEIENEN